MHSICRQTSKRALVFLWRPLATPSRSNGNKVRVVTSHKRGEKQGSKRMRTNDDPVVWFEFVDFHLQVHCRTQADGVKSRDWSDEWLKIIHGNKEEREATPVGQPKRFLMIRLFAGTVCNANCRCNYRIHSPGSHSHKTPPFFGQRHERHPKDPQVPWIYSSQKKLYPSVHEGLEFSKGGCQEGYRDLNIQRMHRYIVCIPLNRSRNGM